MQRPWGSVLGKIIFALVGVAAIGIGIWHGVATIRFLDRAIPLTGRVVLAPGETGDIAGAHPTIEFATPDGRVIRYRQNGMGSRRVGVEMPVLYDPTGRDAPVARGFWTLWFPVVLPFFLGIGFVVIAATCEIGIRGTD